MGDEKMSNILHSNEYITDTGFDNPEIKTFSSVVNNDDILQMYLKQIGRKKMLNKKEEMELGRLIREGNDKEKEQAKREQKEATTNGYSSGLIEQKEDNSLSVSLGLVLKGTEVSFTIEYLTRIDVDDEKLVFSIPFDSNNLKNNEKDARRYFY